MRINGYANDCEFVRTMSMNMSIFTENLFKEENAKKFLTRYDLVEMAKHVQGASGTTY
jgi:hypothetical protein